MPYEKTIRIVRQTLLETMAELDTWFTQSEESCSYQPQDGGWSIQAILEHVCISTNLDNTELKIKQYIRPFRMIFWRVHDLDLPL
jgi:hypothetical protein